jgi:hypothetical protein
VELRIFECPHRRAGILYFPYGVLHISNLPGFLFEIVLADDAAAWDEGSKVCGDLILTIIDRLHQSPEWRLEVADESGTIRHLFRVTAETFDH